MHTFKTNTNISTSRYTRLYVQYTSGIEEKYTTLNK